MTAGGLTISQNGLPRVISNFDRAAKAMRAETRAAVSRATIRVEADLKSVGLTGPHGSSPLFGVTGAAGDTLGVRSGATRRSVTSRVFDTGATVTGVVGSSAPHIRIQEQGGTIHGAQYLRIPTVNAQTGAGVDRYAGMSIRGIPGSFLFRSAAGNLWAAVRDSGALKLLYLLKRSVTLRPRRMFAATLDRQRPAINAELRRAVTSVVARANGAA